MTAMTAPPIVVREFDISAQSTEIFGRVLCSARNHHFIADGPQYNKCPGEALTPPELFLTAVASCSVELIHVIAREEGKAVGHVNVDVHGVVDRSKQPRTDVTLFTQVTLSFTVRGADQATAEYLVAAFQRRCPIYGTIAVATGPGNVITSVRAI
jgi:uncharacterized OsmC-like protein